jgi:predicted RNase H-related nuclease YkuK (DUF458 family)
MTFAPEFYGGGVVVTGAAVPIALDGSIYVQVGAAPNYRIECNQEVTFLALTFVVEDAQKLDVAEVVNGDITKTGMHAELALTLDMTSVERTLNWSLVNNATGESVSAGKMFVTYDAEQD